MALRMPPLRDVHEANGATFTPFGGWEMPVEFDSIRTEHTAVRERVGIFDVSHMGELWVRGPDADTLCQRLTTNDVDDLTPGMAQYGLITNEDGVILDDTITYRLDDEEYLVIPNAGHDEEAESRWVEHRDRWELDATIENDTEQYAMFAVQGPDAEALLVDVVGDAAAELGFFEAIETTAAGADCLLARTGYTGEDGFEVICSREDAVDVWNVLDCQPCGLGARDTLRMEMGFLLSGQDFHPTENPRTPFEAGVGFAVDLTAEPAFVGHGALADQHEAGVDEQFVGLTLVDRGVPRAGYEITDGTDAETVVGEVTSGTMSPTLGEPIGLGYVPVEYGEPGTEIGVLVRGWQKRARVETLPFLEDKR